MAIVPFAMRAKNGLFGMNEVSAVGQEFGKSVAVRCVQQQFRSRDINSSRSVCTSLRSCASGSGVFFEFFVGRLCTRERRLLFAQQDPRRILHRAVNSWPGCRNGCRWRTLETYPRWPTSGASGRTDGPENPCRDRPRSRVSPGWQRPTNRRQFIVEKLCFVNAHDFHLVREQQDIGGGSPPVWKE